MTVAVACVGHGNGGGTTVGAASRFPHDIQPDGWPTVISSLCCGGVGSGSSSPGKGSSPSPGMGSGVGVGFGVGLGEGVGVGVNFGVEVGVAFFELVCGFFELGTGFGVGLGF
jgi:hypothetical protein